MLEITSNVLSVAKKLWEVNFPELKLWNEVSPEARLECDRMEQI